MKNLILAISMAVASCTVIRCAADSIASTNADYMAGEVSSVIITPEMKSAVTTLFGENAANQLLHAMELTMTKYDRDMMSESGRRAWHGRLLREEINTNHLSKVSVYTNEVTGKVWRYRQPFKPVSVARYNSSLPRSSATNGVPASLAAARARRDAERSVVSNVTVNVEANK